LNVNDEFILAQIFGEAHSDGAASGFPRPSDALGLRPAFSRGQRFADAVGPVAPPISRQRRVQTFASEKGTDDAAYSGSRLGLGQDALFVLGAVGTCCS
jgi:hypothetical protein